MKDERPGSQITHSCPNPAGLIYFSQVLKIERYQQRLEGLKFKITFQSLLDGVNEVCSFFTVKICFASMSKNKF